MTNHTSLRFGGRDASNTDGVVAPLGRAPQCSPQIAATAAAPGAWS